MSLQLVLLSLKRSVQALLTRTQATRNLTAPSQSWKRLRLLNVARFINSRRLLSIGQRAVSPETGGTNTIYRYVHKSFSDSLEIWHVGRG